MPCKATLIHRVSTGRESSLAINQAITNQITDEIEGIRKLINPPSRSNPSAPRGDKLEAQQQRQLAGDLAHARAAQIGMKAEPFTRPPRLPTSLPAALWYRWRSSNLVPFVGQARAAAASLDLRMTVIGPTPAAG